MKLNMQEAFEMLTAAFGKSTMRRTQVQLRYNRSKKGRKDVNDDDHNGHASTPLD